MSPENANRVAGVLRDFGFADAEAQPFIEPRKIVRMGEPPVRLEILPTISGVEFDECYERRIDAEPGGVPVKLIRLDDLKVNKRESGRLKDQLDLEQLK